MATSSDPVDVLTARVRCALAALLLASLVSSEHCDPADAPSPRHVRAEPPADASPYSLDVLARVTLGSSWAPALLSTAISAALRRYAGFAAPLNAFTIEIGRALAEMVTHLVRLVALGDLDASEVQFVQDASELRVGREELGKAVEAAIRLFHHGKHAPLRRRYEEDCLTPYTVPLRSPRLFAAVIRPIGYEHGEWEYDLSSLSPDLRTLHRRATAGYVGDGDSVMIAYAEVRLEPAAAGDDAAHQTEICDVAIREKDGVESFDLHSFCAAGHGPAELVVEFPIEPHPAGPITREATVRLVLVRHIPLDAVD